MAPSSISAWFRSPGEAPHAGAERALRERVGIAARGLRTAGLVEHVFTHRALRLHVFRAEAKAGRVRRAGFDAHRWVSPAAIARLPHGALTAKALALLAL
ncbi:MAG TPA: NUDIX domain-containing protein [Myxococcota bacterium]|nr:NUDIX domain-containing protein [Myxococcota bacterium]